MKTIQAKWYGPGRSVPVRVIVIHDMEAPEGPNTAENVANWFRTMPASSKASAHVCVDNDSTVRCVADGDRAWHAPGANSDGLGIELAGYARQSRAEWLDPYSKAVIERAAKVVADWCEKYGIPARRLTVAELKAGKKGIVGHVDVSKAYGQTNHYDPGPNFPWDYLISRVKAHLAPEPGPVEPPKPSKPPTPSKPSKYVPPAFPKGLKPNSAAPSAKALQRALKAAGLMAKGVPEAANYGPKTQDAVASFHRRYPKYAAKGVARDVAIGPKGWTYLFTLVYGK
ncbi:N-acetylmuramoyl-L-alanine amidase [Streptomyces sp. MBT56]|uniref:N-acetylmuramoyl-L-alanine amidase n=1 Tax=unclassified Streptomyces TaxID=2593676 RepID=UPI00190A1842|nr:MULTISPECIES: peptidoglycan recognition family protein [unclassified Streptomyces]MBK3559305.1 N-acetylmuramoyl-L-alanine amidase [Streptomyces sp. MBT56]MBK3601028.1 N-acetylmuramoyl-L-alanine amidase [Streptomyces sp. MBT54]MBK3613934.1 N-acetylmuramoyl-L-alanine amidase [Streptomyces sp. MBT98]MBK6042001.1 N-acetylmuramoyl-L-alanine amidase [Streptomyces sp. MBT55]